jgi:anion-transporting  ArsA/GET3 family ATPase
MGLPRVIFVTGKGGTGKSTVTAALVLALSRRGAVTLVDLDRRRSAIKALVGVSDSDARRSHPIELIALTPRSELEAFIERIVPVKAIARRMLRSRTFGFVSAALPGLEEFLILERVRLLANAATPDRFIVIDAPATGGALELLRVPAGVQRLAPIGTLNRLAAEVEEFIRHSGRFGVLLTTRPEELSMREAAEASATLDTLGVRCVGIVLNECEASLFSETEIAALSGLEEHQRLAEARRRAAQSAAHAKRKLRHSGRSVFALPMIHKATLAAEELETLASALDSSWLSR